MPYRQEHTFFRSLSYDIRLGLVKSKQIFVSISVLIHCFVTLTTKDQISTLQNDIGKAVKWDDFLKNNYYMFDVRSSRNVLETLFVLNQPDESLLNFVKDGEGVSQFISVASREETDIKYMSSFFNKLDPKVAFMFMFRLDDEQAPLYVPNFIIDCKGQFNQIEFFKLARMLARACDYADEKENIQEAMLGLIEKSVFSSVSISSNHLGVLAVLVGEIMDYGSNADVMQSDDWLASRIIETLTKLYQFFKDTLNRMDYETFELFLKYEKTEVLSEEQLNSVLDDLRYVEKIIKRYPRFVTEDIFKKMCQTIKKDGKTLDPRWMQNFKELSDKFNFGKELIVSAANESFTICF